MKLFLLLCLVGAAQAINEQQLHGLKKLLKNLDSGVFPTCRIVLFSELVDFNTAEKNCEVSEFKHKEIFCGLKIIKIR